MPQILNVIDQAHIAFKNLKSVVFSGGECTMLGADLISSIEFATSKGLSTRIVSNGHWGAGTNRPIKFVENMRSAGLKEINLSTGLDHAQFVPISSIITAAVCAVKANIFTLITVELDSENSNVYETLMKSKDIIELTTLEKSKFQIQRNTWMRFNDSHIKRPTIKSQQTPQSKGCDQLFNNIVITAHGNVSACCGLTFEHIPELRVGNIDSKSLIDCFDSVMADFMKIWISVDGPEEILNKIFDRNPPLDLISSEHYCATCANLYQNQLVKETIRKRYREFYPEIMAKFYLNRFIREQVISAHLSSKGDSNETTGNHQAIAA